jgi:hypothetical protein
MKNSVALLICLVALFLTSCGRFEGAFHFLRESPKEEAIPGSYVLDRGAYSEGMLKSMGYSDLSVAVVLKKDRTFEIVRMPDCWLTDFSDSKGGYDSCKGTWSVYKNHSVYSVSLSIDSWSADSTYTKEKKRGGFAYTGAFTLTKEEDRYGLALALAAGDKGHLYFKRQKRGLTSHTANAHHSSFFDHDNPVPTSVRRSG